MIIAYVQLFFKVIQILSSYFSYRSLLQSYSGKTLSIIIGSFKSSLMRIFKGAISWGQVLSLAISSSPALLTDPDQVHTRKMRTRFKLNTERSKVPEHKQWIQMSLFLNKIRINLSHWEGSKQESETAIFSFAHHRILSSERSITNSMFVKWAQLFLKDSFLNWLTL